MDITTSAEDATAAIVLDRKRATAADFVADASEVALLT